MFKNFIQRFFFQIVLIGAVVAFLGIFFYAYSLETNKLPTEMEGRLKSSFGKPAIVQTKSNSGIAIQHLSGHEVADLLNEIIAESMSFDSSNYDAKVKDMAQYFTAPGYQQYKNYLDTVGFYKALSEQNLKSGAYAEQQPLELNALVQNGAFKWLFEVPVTVSFIPRNAETYENQETKAQNQRFTLKVQFTRIRDTADPSKIQIEFWEVSPARL